MPLPLASQGKHNNELYCLSVHCVNHATSISSNLHATPPELVSAITLATTYSKMTTSTLATLTSN